MQGENSHRAKPLMIRKKPKLSIHQLGLLPQYYVRKYQTEIKMMKKKYSEIDLRQAILAKESFKQFQSKQNKKQPTKVTKQAQKQLQTNFLGRSYSLHHLFNYQVLQDQHLKKICLQKVNCSTQIKSQKRQKDKKQDIFPPIIKRLFQDSNFKAKNLDLLYRTISNQKREIIQMDTITPARRNSNNLTIFQTMKSQNLSYLKHKFKLHKALKQPKYDQEAQDCNLSEQKRFTPELQNQQSIQNLQNQLKKQTNNKKLFISQLKLDNPEINNQHLPKKSYIMKLVNKRQNEIAFLRQPKKRLSRQCISQQQKSQKQIYPLTITSDTNIVTKKLIPIAPSELLLKKLSVSPTNTLKQEKYQRFIALNRNKTIQNKVGKSQKDKINGWDINQKVQREEDQEQNVDFGEYASKYLD